MLLLVCVSQLFDGINILDVKKCPVVCIVPESIVASSEPRRERVNLAVYFRTAGASNIGDINWKPGAIHHGGNVIRLHVDVRNAGLFSALLSHKAASTWAMWLREDLAGDYVGSDWCAHLADAEIDFSTDPRFQGTDVCVYFCALTPF